MELQFKKETFRWMRPAVHQVQTQEQTQELKISDGMPDIGRVLGAWGQPILRSKEWRSDGFSVSGGMMVWVLYAPEDGTQVRSISGWIPWQTSWNLPSGTPDGKIRVLCLPRFVDARSVSPRKIMVRAGLSALGEGLVEDQGETYSPPELPEDVELLQNTYPVRLTVEAGEKAFQLDEELVLPQSCPVPAKLVSCSIRPEVSESRVLSNRVLFRGAANVHVVYLSEEGQLFSWDILVSLSQYDDLDSVCTADAQADFWIMPTDLDVDLDEEGHIRLKCGMVAQYAVEDVRQLPVVEDAYSPVRELTMEQMEQTLLPVLETASREVSMQQTIPQEANVVADVSFLPDFARQRRNDGSMEMEIPGTVQVLYYSPEGVLQSAASRWEGNLNCHLAPEAQLYCIPVSGGMPEAQITPEGIRLNGQVSMMLRTLAEQSFSSVTAMEPGQMVEPDPNRPSLILCRAGEDSLWQLARENGSTVSAIREASGLEGEPRPGQMLLIPVL